jgi:hypothetical protein
VDFRPRSAGAAADGPFSVAAGATLTVPAAGRAPERRRCWTSSP